MEPAYIILMILMIVLFILAVIWTFSEELYNFVTKLAFSLKPFSAKAVYRRNVRDAKRACRDNKKELKRLILKERNQLKEEINDNVGYCYVDIIFDDNFEWLEKKGFKITETKEEGIYRISWGGKK